MSNWETVGKINDGWEDISDWETVSPKKRNTSFSEDLGIGLGQATSTVVKGGGLVLGGLAGHAGMEDLRDTIFKGSGEIAKETEDYWIPKDADQTFMGKLTSVGGTLPMQLAAMPFSGADTTRKFLESGETEDKALSAGLVDTVGNMAGIALPASLGGGLLARTTAGAGMNAAQDVVTRQVISSLADTGEMKHAYKPTGETTALAAVLGAGFGAFPTKGNPDAKPNPKQGDEFTPEKFTDERKLLEESRKQATDDLSKLYELEKAAIREFEMAPKDERQTAQHTIDVLRESIRKTEEHLNVLDELTNSSPVRPQRPVEEVPARVEEDVAQKKSPVEVALTKIGEALSDTPEQLQQRIQKTREALENLHKEEIDDSELPGSKYRAKQEALEHELTAYQEIASGKEPNLDWFNGKQDPDSSLISYADLDKIPDIGSTKRAAQEQGELISLEDLNKIPDSEEPSGRPTWDREYTPEGEPLVRQPIDERLSPAQMVQRANYKINTLERMRDAVKSQLDFYDNTSVHAGETDPRTMLESINRQLEHWAEVRETAQKHVKQKDWQESKSTEPAPVDTIPKAKDVQEILDMSKEEWADSFLNNTHLFNQSGVGNKIFYDKSIPIRLRNIMDSLIKKLGLDKDQLFFINDSIYTDRAKGKDPLGSIDIIGNTSIIRMNPAKNLLKLQKTSAKILDNFMPGKLLETYNTVRIAAHEVGHLLMYKYMKEIANTETKLAAFKQAFDDHLSLQKLENIFPTDFHKGKQLRDYQTKFSEFFAEQVTKTLIYDHLMGTRFSKYTKLNDVLATQMAKLIQTSIKIMKQAKVDVNQRNFVNDLVNDVISRNEESIRVAGQTLWERLEQQRNNDIVLGKVKPDTFLFHNKTLQDVKEVATARGFRDAPSWAKDADDLNPLNYPLQVSTAAIRALGTFRHWSTRKLFAKSNIASIYRDNPAIQFADRVIRTGEEYGAKVFNKIWFGDPNRKAWDKASLTAKFSKVKDPDSPYMVVRHATDMDMNIVHDLFKKGFELQLPYADTLQLHGKHLSASQQKLFTVLGDMFKKMWEETVNAEKALGKKNVLPYREGWYPNTRKGMYSVELSVNGRGFRREHFDTKVAAERFQRSLNGLRNVDVGPIVEQGAAVMQTNQMMASIIKDVIDKKFPMSSGMINAEIDKLLLNMTVKGGNRSSHHQHRTNMPGYKGDELLKTPEELGKSFRESIQSLATEYPTSITRNYIKTFLEPRLNSYDHTTREAVRQMMDSALDRNKNYVGMVTKELDHGVETALRFLSEQVLQKEYRNDISTAQKVHNSLVTWFYLMKLMPKLNFTIIGQLLTTPYLIRELSYNGHGLRAWYSFGKGIKNLAEATANTKNGQELRQAWFEVSQKYYTLEPKFIEDLQLATGENKFYEFIKDYVLMRKPAEAMDSLSRLITFSVAYTHYKDIGNSPATAQRLARKATDNTMNVYTTAESAPMFQHAGGLGRVARPLQSFGQRVLGNLITDINYFKAKDINTWAPLVNYMLATTLASGVVGAVFVQEYELLRRFLNSNFKTNLPSIIDMMEVDPTFVERVEPDMEMAKVAMLYGVPTLSGVDLAASTRANLTFLTIAGSVITAEESWTSLAPALGFAYETTAGIGTLLKSKVKDTPQVDIKKAADQVFPAGHLGYSAKEILGVNKTKVGGSQTNMLQFGKEGIASKPETTQDKIAGYLGTKSTEDRLLNQQMSSRNFDEKLRLDRIEKAANLATETGKAKYITEMVNLGMTEEQIEARLGTEVYKRIVGQDLRFFTNRRGNVDERKASALFSHGR